MRPCFKLGICICPLPQCRLKASSSHLSFRALPDDARDSRGALRLLNGKRLQVKAAEVWKRRAERIMSRFFEILVELFLTRQFAL